MSTVSRRGLFGLFAGAAIAPMLPAIPKVAAPMVTRELEFAAAGTFQRYTGYEVLNITPSIIRAASEYDWKAATSTVAIR